MKKFKNPIKKTKYIDATDVEETKVEDQETNVEESEEKEEESEVKKNGFKKVAGLVVLGVAGAAALGGMVYNKLKGSDDEDFYEDVDDEPETGEDTEG